MMDAAQANRRNALTRYLDGIERLGAGSDYESLYLWPGTPMDSDHQPVIAKRVGVDDYQLDDPRSRSALVISTLRKLIAAPLSSVDERFELLDLACGDAVVLWQVKKAFPSALCVGVDCNKGRFPTHDPAASDGVALYRGYLQHVLAEPPPHRLDVILMLNSYRGWESAHLREAESDLPEQADAWFARSGRHVIVTATTRQIKRLRHHGWLVDELGKGEDDSTMICMSPDQGRSAVARLAKRTRRWLAR
jgi:hypothetical protein